uniref:Uncharacterized protein n=1 Tax=Rhizophora mucronata TaxID=61149 RepID=A0A2P2N4E4_RHIMU
MAAASIFFSTANKLAFPSYLITTNTTRMKMLNECMDGKMNFKI